MKFSNMFQAHSSVMLLINPITGKIVDANRSASLYYGYDISELKQMFIFDINCASKEFIKKNLIEAFKLDNNNIFNFKHILKNGEIKDVEVHSSPITTKNETLLFSIINDITAKKRLETQITEEKNFISTIIENANCIIAVIDISGTMIKLNKYGQEFTGYSQEEVSSKPFFWKRFLPLEYQDKVIEVFKKARNGDFLKSYQNSWISRSGDIRFFEWSNTLVTKEDGSMNYLATIGIDITEQEKQKKEIKEQKDELQTIFNNAKDGIAIIDLKSKFLDFNDAYLQITGYTREELLTKTSIELTIPDQKNIAKDNLKIIKKENFIKNYPRSYLNKKNEIVNLNISSTLLPDRKRILITAKDITKEKLFEEQSKLASMGEMIGNIAHQWRQPLSVISTISSSVKLFEEYEQPLEKDELIKDMDIINNQIQYLSKTIDDFRNFIKINNEKENVSIRDFITKSLIITNPSFLNNNIIITTDLKDDFTIHGFKNELIQSLINILNNSKDALKQNNAPENRYVFINTKKFDDKFILEIKDNGGGIKENIIDKIFEPYFTTKHQSIGTGIGLSMTYKILTQHHSAKIEVFNSEFKFDDKPMKGLCFRIIF